MKTMKKFKVDMGGIKEHGNIIILIRQDTIRESKNFGS